MLTSKQIIYTGIVGGVMLAALLEWILWLSAFTYCLVQAFKKAEHWSNMVLAVVVGVVFVGLRYEHPSLMPHTLRCDMAHRDTANQLTGFSSFQS